MNSQKSTLLLSQSLTERILKFTQEALLVLNASDCIETINDAALRLFGFSEKEELLGRHIQEFYFYPDDADNFIVVSQREGCVEGWEDTFKKSDGKKFTGLYSGTILKDENDGVEAKVIFIQDISSKKKVEEQLEEYAGRLEKKNIELDQFAYIVSHDLKAPLRAISNLSLWLMEDLGDTLSADNKKNLDMMRGRVARMESLINGILEYSKVGRAEVSSESVDVSMLLSEILELLSLPSHIKIRISEEMPIVVAPKIMLLQVFSNLISNAIKYNDKKEGIISISALANDEYYEFTVEDNGPGIASEFHEKIFLIFQTLQSRDKFESTGIGLTIVKRIIEEQGGNIRLESEIGKGSKFIFQWPLHSQELIETS